MPRLVGPSRVMATDQVMIKLRQSNYILAGRDQTIAVTRNHLSPVPAIEALAAGACRLINAMLRSPGTLGV